MTPTILACMSDEPGRRLADLPEVLTVEEVSEALRISVRQVHVLIREGDIPAFRLGPRITRVFRDALIDVIEQSKVVGEASDEDGDAGA